jgi:hypothetical protein
MALEFICARSVGNGKKIKIPQGASYYIRKAKTVSPRKGREPRIHFFNANPSPTKRMKPIPPGAAYVSFNMEWNEHTIEYGQPIFYDPQGNDLNIGENC